MSTAISAGSAQGAVTALYKVMQVVDNLVINCGNAVIGVSSTNIYNLFYI
jgi:hypothetical protein